MLRNSALLCATLMHVVTQCLTCRIIHRHHVLESSDGAFRISSSMRFSNSLRIADSDPDPLRCPDCAFLPISGCADSQTLTSLSTDVHSSTSDPRRRLRSCSSHSRHSRRAPKLSRSTEVHHHHFHHHHHHHHNNADQVPSSVGGGQAHSGTGDLAFPCE